MIEAYRPGPLTRALQSAAWRIMCRLARRDVTDVGTNGEARFVRGLAAATMGQFVFFDVGANQGGYVRVVLEILGRRECEGHLFEPQQACLKSLRGEFGPVPGVRINAVAVSDAEGEALLHVSTTRSGLSSLYDRSRTVDEIHYDGAEIVRTVRLDHYMNEHGVLGINRLKIDVEGYEYKALQGLGDCLRPSCIQCVQFEYGGTNLDAHTRLEDFYRLLQGRGYVVGRIMPRGVELGPYRPAMDDFRYANYAALAPGLLGLGERDGGE